MLHSGHPISVNCLKDAFESGYKNAASSLSLMTKNKINFNNFHFDFHQISNLKPNQTLSRHGSNYLLTTEIFGEVTGKSYLLLSDQEFELFTSRVPEKKGINLKEEFVKELDNILSASVITKVSNSLNRNMYGDIPLLIGKISGSIMDLIYDDFCETTEEIYVNSAYFTTDSNSAIGALFIWVIDSIPLNIEEKKSA